MQVMADVLNMPIRVARSEQAVALGAAMFAAVVSGLYENIGEAQAGMGAGFDAEYKPLPENVKKYRSLYRAYERLGDFMEKDAG